MPKARSCPHCHAVVPVDNGFHFDEQMNLICDVCGKIMMAATQNGEDLQHQQYAQDTKPVRIPYEQRQQ